MGKLCKIMYYLCVFSMVVPFQMVMFTLSKTADTSKAFQQPLDNICIIYLGFGAGLAVFMFTGFVKTMPLEIEEQPPLTAATPVQYLLPGGLPMLKPTMISTAFWRPCGCGTTICCPPGAGYQKYRTIPMAIQYFRGSYGKVEMAPHDGLHHDSRVLSAAARSTSSRAWRQRCILSSRKNVIDGWPVPLGKRPMTSPIF